MFAKKKDSEVTFTIGRLAHKLGMGRNALEKHLYNTGLIDDCYRDPHNNYLRIPYTVALDLAGGNEKALEGSHPRRRNSGRRQKVAKTQPPKEPETEDDTKANPMFGRQERYQFFRQLARTMVEMGIKPKEFYEYQWRQIQGEQGGNDEEKTDE